MTLETKLRRKIVSTLCAHGYSLDDDTFAIEARSTKAGIRALHADQRRHRLEQSASFLRTRGLRHLSRFADGTEILPEAISPRLVPVPPNSEDADLFRLAMLTWSVPASHGFGRRLRFLVEDSYNNKLIGLLALGDPVFNLAVRDRWIGWSLEQKTERLVNVMDAFILGAVPPYSNLLGGKLVAMLLASTEITRLFDAKYGNAIGTLTQRCKHPKLALVTATSALGRSSLYNRLRLPAGPTFQRIGETRGFGYFHMDNSLFEDVRALLKHHGHPYTNGNRYGNGPNWKMRVLRVGLQLLGLSPHLLHHGVTREVYALELFANTRQYLTDAARPGPSHCMPCSQLADFWKERWLMPRASRDKSHLSVTRQSTLASILSPCPDLVDASHATTLALDP